MQVNSPDVIYKWSCKFLYKPFLRHSRPLVCVVCDVRKWCRKKKVTNGHVKFRPSVHITKRSLFFGISHRVFISMTVTKVCTYLTFLAWTQLCHCINGRTYVYFLTTILLVAQRTISTAYTNFFLYIVLSCLWRWEENKRVQTSTLTMWKMCASVDMVQIVNNVSELLRTCSTLWIIDIYSVQQKKKMLFSCFYDNKLLGNVNSIVSELAMVKCRSAQ